MKEYKYNKCTVRLDGDMDKFIRKTAEQKGLSLTDPVKSAVSEYRENSKQAVQRRMYEQE